MIRTDQEQIFGNSDWISDGNFIFKEKKASPRPMVFHRQFDSKQKVREAKIYATALGIYEIDLNGEKVGEQYFAPGFTSYAHDLQYQVYDVTDQLESQNEIFVTVAGGWAVGSYTMSRKNKFYGERQALLLELHIHYENGETEIIGTDTSWEVSVEGSVIGADLYDGEIVDARIEDSTLPFHPASLETLRIQPKLSEEYGEPVKRQEVLHPIAVLKSPSGKTIYDFGQNFAGVVELQIEKAKAGQEIVVRHAEILTQEGELNTHFLRTAKATLRYICRDGAQSYSPRFTYMGFRYVSVEGIAQEDLEIKAYALYSDVEEIGKFECSNELLNRLQKNILWSAKSNFVDIPTDCPQRDERMGWTGDIAVFAPVACFNFRMKKFFDKWLRDARSEQLSTGGLPNTIPSHHYRYPYTLPHIATDFWGDAIVLVPWAVYWGTGDVQVLKDNYTAMKKYVDACRFWARILSSGKNSYIWHTASFLHYGDWTAPGANFSEWQKRSKWTATASLYHTSYLLSQIAGILGEEQDKTFYDAYAKKVANSYSDVLLNGTGKLTKEFQTGYVLPLHFQMLEGEVKTQAIENLVQLVKKADYCIQTGFPGTPYILFTLADNGYADVAYQMLMNTKCPSWLYEVKVGGTTIWERWDALREDGTCEFEAQKDGMVSFNHYASGAVGDFLYRRVAGIEAIKPGYKEFQVKPLLGGGLTYVDCETQCPSGKIHVYWKIEKQEFFLTVDVPEETQCHVYLPDGSCQTVYGGKHTYRVRLQ